MPKPLPPRAPVRCPSSPTGWHELGQYALVGARDDRRFPCGTALHVQCRHCKVQGRALLEDNQVRWDGSPE